MGIVLTNANVQVTDNKRIQLLLKPLAVVLATPELAQSPLTWIDARLGIGNGTVTLTNATVRSSLFEAGLEKGGTMTLNEVLTNSTFNNIPVKIAVVGSVTKHLQFLSATSANNTSSNYVPLPQFYAIGGTLGKPDPHIDKSALLKSAASEAIGRVGGDAGKLLQGAAPLLGLGNTNKTAGTNAANTNATQNLIQGIGNLFNKAPKNTNAPAQRRNR
jgi:hypothetical protein